MFVLINRKGLYVARPGSVSSYTADLSRAAKYATEDDARRHQCIESERIANLERELDKFRQ